MPRAIYRNQGGKRLYKVIGHMMIEIDLESYEYGVIGIIYADRRKCPMDVPNKYSNVCSRAEFDKYYNEGMEKIKMAKRINSMR